MLFELNQEVCFIVRYAVITGTIIEVANRIADEIGEMYTIADEDGEQHLIQEDDPYCYLCPIEAQAELKKLCLNLKSVVDRSRRRFSAIQKVRDYEHGDLLICKDYNNFVIIFGMDSGYNFDLHYIEKFDVSSYQFHSITETAEQVADNYIHIGPASKIADHFKNK